ncbi:MAG: RND family transporter [Gemmatimonadales bacterium]
MSSEVTNRVDRAALRLVEVMIRRPWLVIGLTIIAVLAATSGVRHLEFANNYRVFFSPENPELLAFDEFQDTYTKNDNILFVLQPKEGQVFTPRFAEAIERLTEEAWKIPYAIRVDSISNFQHTWADGDELTVEDLIRNGNTLSEQELSEKRVIALAEPLLLGNLISPDADTTGINVTIQYPEQSLEEVPLAVGYARQLTAQLESDYPGVRIALSGVSMLNNAFAETGQNDSMTLMPLMFGILIVFMVVILRNACATAATLSVIVLSTATALGLAGYLGIKLTPISVIAPVIIMTLAIADSVHILTTMLGLMRDGIDKFAALREALRINFLAVVITTVTTAVGFLTLNFSDSPPFHDLGNMTAIGIASALVYTATFLPALLVVLRMRCTLRAQSGGRVEAGLETLAQWITRRHRAILLTAGLVTIILVALVPFVDLNDEWVKYFDYRVPFRHDAEFAIDNLNGLYPIEFSLPAEGAEGVSDPVYLENLERFTKWLREQPEVTHVYSYSDVIKRLNKNMHADDPAWYRIPTERTLAAQYLLLYELSLPFGLDLNDRINIDKSATRVTATVGNLSTKATRAFLDRGELWLREHTPEFMWTGPTGASVMFSYISQRNIEGMLRGNVLAVVVIAAIMMLALRSFKLGALSLLPNAVPILMTFGLWALLVGKVGMAAATVSASALGIIVDDTVHLLAKYLRARREEGLDQAGAVRYAFRTVGIAIVSTTVILTAGFLVLAGSTFRVNFELGLLTAIAIVLALLTDFFLLPSLLLWGYQPQEQKEATDEAASAEA